MRGCAWMLLLLEAHLATAQLGRRQHHRAHASHWHTDLKHLNDAKTLGGIPKILHQSWKDRNLQPRQAVWRASWKELNPEWSIVLWTDKDNRHFVSDNYPWLLEVWDKLKGIHQADLVRSIPACYRDVLLVGGNCTALQQCAFFLSE